MILESLMQLWRRKAGTQAVVPDITADTSVIPDYRPVFGTMAMPNGHRIVTMREDVFRAALAAAAVAGKSNP